MDDITERLVFTVGHSDHTWTHFVQLLIAHRVDALVDVRSNPYSRKNPHFNRERMHEGLLSLKIHYLFFGDELGARRIEPECYVRGKARYELIARTLAFQSGLARLRRGIPKYRIALMCAERDPLTCHRTILICRHLKAPGLCINHILPDGDIESHEQSERRLLQMTGLANRDLFHSKAETIADAYDIQAERIAYATNAFVPREVDQL